MHFVAASDRWNDIPTVTSPCSQDLCKGHYLKVTRILLLCSHDFHVASYSTVRSNEAQTSLWTPAECIRQSDSSWMGQFIYSTLVFLQNGPSTGKRSRFPEGFKPFTVSAVKVSRFQSLRWTGTGDIWRTRPASFIVPGDKRGERQRPQLAMTNRWQEWQMWLHARLSDRRGSCHPDSCHGRLSC